MKERISATIDKETRELLEEALKKGNYRNLSHLIEDTIKERFGKGRVGK